MKKVILFIFSLFSLTSSGSACDPCALYTASALEGHSKDSLTLSISEQYTDYSKSKETERYSQKSGEIVNGYSTTGFGVAYDFTERFGMHLTVPLIIRDVDTIKNYRSDRSTDSGLGDISLLGTYSFFEHRKSDWTILAGAYGGVKLPTGDSGVLEDIAEEELTPDSSLKHHPIGSASNGRALTFGSGSYDFIGGLTFLARHNRLLFLSSAQYTIRTEGDFDYEFADDFLFSAGPGYYFALEHNYTVAGRLSLAGEYKGKDRFKNENVNGSAISNLYLGPQVFFTYDEHYAGEATVDFRVTDEDSVATVVPEWRIRAGLSYRFSLE